MNASQTVGSFGTVRARAGVLLMAPLLLYGTGGLAFAQASANLAVHIGKSAVDRPEAMLAVSRDAGQSFHYVAEQHRDLDDRRLHGQPGKP